MGITVEDINLKRFLEKVAPTSFPEAGKLTIPDINFLEVAFLAQICSKLDQIRMK